MSSNKPIEGKQSNTNSKQETDIKFDITQINPKNTNVVCPDDLNTDGTKSKKPELTIDEKISRKIRIKNVYLKIDKFKQILSESIKEGLSPDHFTILTKIKYMKSIYSLMTILVEKYSSSLKSISRISVFFEECISMLKKLENAQYLSRMDTYGLKNFNEIFGIRCANETVVDFFKCIDEHTNINNIGGIEFFEQLFE